VVRELFVKEFAKVAHTELHFDALGPSPFHADFFVELEDGPREDSKSGLNLVRDRCLGYDSLTCYADSRVFHDIEEAKKAAYAQLCPEQDVFYWFAQIRADEMGEWGLVQEAIHSLIGSESVEGTWNKILRFTRTRRLIAEAYGRSSATRGS